MRGLSTNFGYHARGAEANANSAPSVSATPQDTILALLSDINLSANVDVSQNVDPAKPGAQALAQSLTTGLVGKQQEVKGKHAAACDVIKGAQNEIKAAQAAVGPSADKAFPVATGNDSLAGAAFSVAVESKTGKGSVATFKEAVSVGSTIKTIADSAHGGSSAASAKAEIADVLCQASYPSQENASSFGHVKSADEAPDMPASKFAWNDVLEQYPEALEAIMMCDPNDPNPDLFPEIHALVCSQDDIQKNIDNLAASEEKANKLGTPSFGGEECACIANIMGTDLANVYGDNIGAGLHLASMDASDVNAIIGTKPHERVAEVAAPAGYDREQELAMMAERAAQVANSPAPPMSRVG